MRHVIYIIVLCCWAATVAPQAVAQERIVTRARVVNGDTIPSVLLAEVTIRPHTALLSPDEIRNNQKLIRNVKKMLPYAKEGKRRLDILERQCQRLSTKQRKTLIKQAEKDLLADYTAELERCTISQGKVLLKLIDRETSQTPYALVDGLRGKVRASFYQTFARLFGFNLKAGFDPCDNSEDDLIERICLSIEQGKL